MTQQANDTPQESTPGGLPTDAEIAVRSLPLWATTLVEAKSSIALEGPTASQRGGLPQPKAHVYYLPGEADKAFEEVTALYQRLLDWRPAEKAE